MIAKAFRVAIMQGAAFFYAVKYRTIAVNT